MSTPQKATCLHAQVQLVTDLCEVVDTPRSLCVWLLLRSAGTSSPDDRRGDSAYSEYLALPPPVDTGDHERYCGDRLVSEALKKSQHLPLGIDTRQTALDTFRATERTCAETNDRLWREEEPMWLPRARRWIEKVLGEPDLDMIMELSHHGPGASNGVPASGNPGSLKYDNPCTVTAELKPYAGALMGPLWASYATPVIVKGSIWTSVPKNAKTDRSIATEPTLNMFLQLGIGTFIRKRLKRFGIDLLDQRWNQALAEMAETWGLATIDLSSASDLIAYEVVRKLLPPKWVTLLALCRSASMQVDGVWVKLNKWSSMGNGYTFPLESLIFASVVRAIVPRRDRCVTAIYGDDIIVPQKSAPEVIDALAFLGASVNGTKSFLAGSFFESCGMDFLRGRQCRPLHLTTWKPPIPYAVQLANALRLWAGHCFGYNPVKFRPIWEDLVAAVKGPWSKTCVPASYGDSGIISAQPWKVYNKHGWEGYAVRHVMFIPTDRSHISRDTFAVLLKAYSQLATGVSEDNSSLLSFRFGKVQLAENGLPKGIFDALFTRGVEPLRGIFGKPVARIGFTSLWTRGLDWI